MRRMRGLVILATVAVFVAACGGSSKPSTGTATTTKATAATGKLVLDNESGATWTCHFNPYNPAVAGLAFGYVYEPLEFVDILKNGAVTPWLATSSSWSSNFKTLTFTIRSGVKWSDGQPFSAKDVVYTFNAIGHDKAIDLNALWKSDGGPLTSATLSRSNQVVLKFDAPAQSYFYYVADQTPIIPQHIFGSQDQSKLEAFADPNPVGTGPYTVSSCSAQNIKYVANPHYWQSKPGHVVPAVEEVDYPAFLSNTSANLFLSQGQAQWGSQYIPNINSFYTAKDPAHRQYYFAPILNVGLFPNLENSLLGNLAVRNAISLAIDRPVVAARGESGYQKPANAAGVVLPTFQKWYDSSLPPTTYSTSQADKVLSAAGFTKGSNGIYEKGGQPLSFTIKTISGFSDWDASLAIITQELKAAGISVTVQDENSGTYTSDLSAGKFQLAYAGSGGPYPTAGPSPYYELRALLFSGNIGSTNYSRYKSAATDALFNQYPGASASGQVQIMHQIEHIIVSQVPFIPVTEGVNWFQYDTSKFTGWPTGADPYAQGAIYQVPDVGVVLTHLVPTG